MCGGFVVHKLVVHFLIAKLFRMSTPDASRFAFMLAQGGEFAFVLISFVAGLGLFGVDDAGLLVAVVAISMALAPLMILFEEKIIQPLFAHGGELREPDVIDETGAEGHHCRLRPVWHDGRTLACGERVQDPSCWSMTPSKLMFAPLWLQTVLWRCLPH